MSFFSELIQLLSSDFSTWILWLIIAIVFFIVEAATINLTTIWFAIGALLALGAAFLGYSFATQVLIFTIVSIVTLILFLIVFKPRLKSKNREVPRTNADRIIDQVGVVTREINPLAGTGLILVNKEEWSASSLDNSIIPVGTRVVVRKLSGVKAVVASCDNLPNN